VRSFADGDVRQLDRVVRVANGLAQRRFLTATRLETSGTDDAVELGDHPGELRWRGPTCPEPLEIFVGRPTGDRACFSDVDGNLIVDELREQRPHGRDADALESLGRLA
jgi:hypothetical protein